MKTPEKLTSKTKRLVLLDAHAILHRAYHALPDFSSSKGEATGGLYGVSTMLIRIIQDLKPDYLIAAYDLAEPTYRHQAYEGYKAQRKKADPELISQMDRSRDIFKAFNIPIYDKVGFEADDVIGTIVEEVKNKKEISTIIASGDMDTLQLVRDKEVQVFTLRKGITDTVLYDEKKVLERYGFPPELLPDYKGLRGDPSDNIIGVPGIGEKTATILIKEFGTIENIYKELEKGEKGMAKFKKIGITDRIINLLKEKKEEAFFSKMLSTIRLDAPIKFKMPEKSWQESLDLQKVEEFFRELEFRTLAARLKEVLGVSVVGDEAATPLTNSAEGELVRGGQTHQINFNESFGEPIDRTELRKTAVALWVLDSNITNPTLDDILHFAKIKSFSKAREVILAEIKKRKLENVYEEIELPLIPVIEKMEKRGVKIDRTYLSELSKKYHQHLQKIEKEIWKLSDEEFNINSPKQLSKIIFDKLGLKAKVKKTAGGALSTRESELLKMRGLHPIIDLILKHRELAKLLSTYIDTLPILLDENNRLHATFSQTGSTTGRMSSNNPNLQNIPIKSELGRNIRKAFVTAKGFKLVAFDYSQIELRVAAILSEDPKLVEIFKSAKDVHTAVASQVFNVPPEMVNAEMRREAKVINFGILYGMGVNALRANLGGTREEAQKFYNEYFKNYSGLAWYLDKVKADAERLGYTETIFGRRRHFAGINSKLPYIKAQAERMAINAPLQGSQSDIIKIAMSEIDAHINKHKWQDKAYLLLQVHDELVYEIKEELIEDLAPKIKEIMENVLPLSRTKGVPIIAHASAGKNWGEMKSV